MSTAAALDTAGRIGRVPVFVQRIALALILLALWWLISLAAPPYVLPRPERVFARMVQLTETGDVTWGQGPRSSADSSVEHPDTERCEPSPPEHHSNCEGNVDHRIAGS